MFNPQQKKEENIAEYILYVWQVEDLIRHCNLETRLVEELIMRDFFGSIEEESTLKSWYTNLVSEMKAQKLYKQGHVEEVNELIAELNFLHNSLINVFQDRDYISLYEEASENIFELMKRSNKTAKSNIEACLIGLYGILILRMKKKQINAETLEAIKTISSLIAYLSSKYKQMKNGSLDFPKVKSN